MRVRHLAALAVVLLVAGFATATARAEYEVGPPSEALKESAERESKRAAQEQTEENERAAKSAEEAKATQAREQGEAAERQRQERERAEAERTTEAAEQQAKEATERQAKEAGERQAKEAAERRAKEATSRCVVPSLRGHSLSKVTVLLKKAHCKLGKISGRRTGVVVVVAQKLKPGARFAAGTAVGVTVGVPRYARG